MAVDRLLRTVLSFKEVKSRHDDDFVDRLSRTYTTSLLILLAFFVSTKQFVGEPMSCWCPAYFTDSHRSYTNTICWISNTFYVPFDHRIPDTREELWRERPMISYYQWVPLIFVSQAALVALPALVWRFLSMRSGIHLASLMDAAKTCQQATYAEIREKTVRYIVGQMDKYLLAQRDYGNGCCARAQRVASRYCFAVGGRRQGNYLMVCYVLVKVLYALNVVAQVFILGMLLDIDYHLYGVHVIVRMLRGQDWQLSERFPRITLCSFQIRHQARVHDYVVQCALTINLFNEKVFVLLWFWYVIVGMATVFSLIQWLLRAFYWPSQVRFVRNKLRSCEIMARPKTSLVSKFVECYLRRDGMLVIRLLSLNCGELFAAEILAGLWENYGPERRMIAETAASSEKVLQQHALLAPSAPNYANSRKVEVI